MTNVNSETKISSKRIGQIKDILQFTDPNDLEIVASNIKDSMKAIILNVQNQNKKSNKLQKIQLHSFINNYIGELNSFELKELVSVLEFYENIFDQISGDLEEDFASLELIDRFPITKRIKRLLLNGTLLPKCETKKEFKSEMNAIIKRLELYINNQAKKAGLLIRQVNYDDLMFLLQESDEFSYDVSLGKEIGTYLRSINFTLSLPELYNVEEGYFPNDEVGNHMKFELVYTKDTEEGINKSEIIEYLEGKGFYRDGDNFTVYGNDKIEIKIHLYNAILFGYHKEKVSMEVYVQTKQNKITSEQFLELGLYKICKYTQELINDIYSEYGGPRQPFVFDMENLLDKLDGNYDEDEYGQDKNKEKNKKDVWKTRKVKQECSDIILEDKELKELSILEEQLKNEKHFKNYGVEIPKGIVLYGPAGTGKTLFAKHISNKIDGEFMVVKHSEIEDKYVGESEKNMQSKFDKAKSIASSGNKVILFFDEADSLFEKRSDRKNFKEGMISVLLQEMDGISEKSMNNIFVFFTTNRMDAIDPAVLSRFDKKINIGLPKKAERIKHFKLNIDTKVNKSKSNLFKDINYELLATKTEGKSGRFIKQLINNIVLDFAHSRINNSRSKLITTQNIIDGIKLIEKEEKTSKGIGFSANI